MIFYKNVIIVSVYGELKIYVVQQLPDTRGTQTHNKQT